MSARTRSQWVAIALTGITLAATALAGTPAASATHAEPIEADRIFYFHGDDGAAAMREGRPQAPAPRVVVERDDGRAEASFASPILDKPLSIAREESFVVTLDEREAFHAGAFQTRLTIMLLDPHGGVLFWNGEPVVLAEATFEHQAEAALGDPLGVEPVTSGIRGAAGSVLRAAADSSSASQMHEKTTGAICPRQDASSNPYCDTLYGDYGFGVLRPCDPHFRRTWAGGIARSVGDALGDDDACARHGAANASRDAAHAADAEGGDAFAHAAHALRAAANATDAEAREDEGWRTFRFDVRPHPMLQSDANAIIVPAGHRLFLMQELRAEDDARADLDETYRDGAMPVAVHALETIRPWAHISVGNTSVAGRSVPGMSLDPAGIARHHLENATTLQPLDHLVANPVPSARWTFGDAGATSGLRIRTLTTVPEERPFFADGFDAGASSEWTFSGLWHVESGCLGARSPTASLQYNQGATCDYNVTDANGHAHPTAGIASVTVDLSHAQWSATLRFHERHHVESYQGAVDRMRVEYECAAGAGILDQWDSRDPGPTAWTERTYDVSACIGGAITLTFSFNSLDHIANDYGGWALDDITLNAA